MALHVGSVSWTVSLNAPEAVVALMRALTHSKKELQRSDKDGHMSLPFSSDTYCYSLTVLCDLIEGMEELGYKLLAMSGKGGASFPLMLFQK